MNTIRIITLSLLAVIQLGCFESFEDAIERENKIFTCDDDERSCITGYKCVSFTTPNGTERRCERTEDLPADMAMPAPDLQMGQPDTGSNRSTEDAVVTDETLDMEVMDAAVPDMEVMDAAIPDSQLVDSCIPELDTIQLGETVPLTECPVEALEYIMNICGLSDCVYSTLTDCRTVFTGNTTFPEQERMLNFIDSRLSKLNAEQEEAIDSCGEVLGPSAKAFFEFVQNGLGSEYQSIGCTGAQGNPPSCQIGPFQDTLTIGSQPSITWTSESTIRGYATNESGMYREVDGFNNVIELSPQQRGKILWSLRLPPGLDAVSHIQVSLQGTADATLIGNGSDVPYRYTYAVQSNSQLCLPPVFEHGGSNEITAPPVAESGISAVAQTLSFGSGVSRAVQLSERTELGVLLGGAAYDIKVEIQNPSETTLKLSLDHTAIVPVTFFDAPAMYSLINPNCLPDNYLEKVCDALLVNECNTEVQGNCNTETSRSFCSRDNLTAFAEDVFYSAFAYDSNEYLQGNYYQCVNRTDCGHAIE